jgi:glutamate formiminotransferase
MALIEAVPNLSEGRRRAVVHAAEAAVRSVSGLRLLDVHSDPDHNRSVFTIVAREGEPLIDGLLRLVELAVSAIDLTRHRGQHPRLGAVDVVPFVPVEETTMEECVHLARRFGRSAAERFDLPVYLYEDAAIVPERRRLEEIRRGQFEGLADKMADPRWAPDFGPKRPHPKAGALIVGARRPLIAFNINLATSDVDAARSIARAVRESAGGLPCVKAIGVHLATAGIAQVSTNITDSDRTPPLAVFNAVRAAAARLGIEILESEIVGLVSERALPADPVGALLWRGYSEDKILERRVHEAFDSRSAR